MLCTFYFNFKANLLFLQPEIRQFANIANIGGLAEKK